MDSEERELRAMMLTYCIVSIIIAATWPFIYPALDYVMALIHFSASPGLFRAIQEFGPIYGKVSATAPGFFKGMAEASQELSFEPPALESLPYMTKAALLMHASIPIYVGEVLLSIAVASLSISSRLLPWQKMKTLAQILAIFVSLVPLILGGLLSVVMIGIAYIQAWSSSVTNFLLLILLFPAVLAASVSPWIGTLALARYFVPASLLLSGARGRAAYESILGD